VHLASDTDASFPARVAAKIVQDPSNAVMLVQDTSGFEYMLSPGQDGLVKQL
jgi:hypothetical protein